MTATYIVTPRAATYRSVDDLPSPVTLTATEVDSREDGALLLVDESGLVALFAPGEWSSVVREPEPAEPVDLAVDLGRRIAAACESYAASRGVGRRVR